MNLQKDVIVVATRNQGKVKEFAHAFAPFGKRVESMFDYPDIPDVVEDGETFEENAMKKAKTVAKALRLPVLADDSGLCVDKLNGAPGVYSARYAGEHHNDADNNKKLLEELGKMRDDESNPLLSAAQFVCTLVLYDPDSEESITATGSVDGYITVEPRGTGGFGYDPLFYLPDLHKTMAELSVEEKQAISHRGQALKQLTGLLSR
ncbi:MULTISPECIES: XTP/dITP diphosphatase [unclassified Paenibacillus]|uniref:XTP/dITP diphosphatase n=1 Tax=unclassified Paenibacillus TaxID=185978 RepID=UPI001C104BE4|nr:MULTISPECIES: XTP/dITP diphosphatase [unclassified Paenibacillus]MBU5444708.1 XTP/dITP diphosphatase [Paenibacillus sp. MSJ-34]CAH0119170.1 dITP/XTP pyrophosphatase [Paenibacillus sp. CECT 9249]